MMLIPGILLEIVLFSIWIGADGSPSQRLAVAGIAQALIVLGAMFAGFGLIYRIVGLRTGYETHPGSIDIRHFDGRPGAPADDGQTADE
jgi:multisubunit Na+/H+ antiporter MnhE subunit